MSISDYDGRLVHVGQWCRIPNSEFGEPTLAGTPSTVATVSCYGYQQLDYHLQQAPVSTQYFNWNALIPLDMTYVEEGDYLRNIVDETGVLVLAQARVKEVQVFRSRFDGVRCINVILERQ